MCVSPSTLRNGVIVGCRRCWQCLANRVDDWAGRNIAEIKTARKSYAIRLSYGRSRDGLSDHLHSVMLFASDMQKFVKRLRSKRFGYKVRYMIAGEYGSTYGRAHWHGILHFYGDKLPAWDGKWIDWSDEEWNRVGGVHIPEWAYDDGTPIGHVHIKPADYAHIRYALKYILKDQDDPHSAIKVLMSKYPPLGTNYLNNYACEIARAGLVPRDLFYRFPIVTYNGEQKVKDFMMRGVVATNFLDAYIAEWSRLYGDRPVPSSDLVGGYQLYGRIGNSEYLSMAENDKKEADKKWADREAAILAENEIRKGIASILNKSTSKAKVRLDLHSWEEKYFGQERQIEFNDRYAVEYLCYRYGWSEQEFWSLPFGDLERLWSDARRDYAAAYEASIRRGDGTFSGFELPGVGGDPRDRRAYGEWALRRGAGSDRDAQKGRSGK